MQEQAQGFEGIWDVREATLPTGAFAYTGTITIDKLGAPFLLDWAISAGHYVGLGLIAGRHLLVSCGEQLAGLGLALFQLNAAERLAIQWYTAELQGEIGTGAVRSPWTGSFEGEHTIVYALPDGRIAGEWTLIAKKTDKIYELTWHKGKSIHFRGIGLEMPEGLAAGWYPDLAQLAFLDYHLDPHAPGQMRAVWALGGYTALGTETLVRRNR
jgi:hypothetical protein